MPNMYKFCQYLPFDTTETLLSANTYTEECGGYVCWAVCMSAEVRLFMSAEVRLYSGCELEGYTRGDLHNLNV